MKTPDRTTAAAFPRYAAAGALADSASLQWPGLYVRRYRFPRVVDRFLVPATPEPLISCGLAGSAEFRERELGETWVTRQIGRGDIFVTRSKTPYEVRHSSRVGEELEIIQVHVAVDHWLESLEAVYPGKGDEVAGADGAQILRRLGQLERRRQRRAGSGTFGQRAHRGGDHQKLDRFAQQAARLAGEAPVQRAELLKLIRKLRERGAEKAAGLPRWRKSLGA